MIDFSNDIEQCLKVLRSGGTILYPTDTVWGLGCDATDAAAVEKIIAIKHRPPQKSFVVLVADEQDILRYTASPDLAVFDYLEKTSKPTTVIYDHALGLAENVIADDGSVAIRIVRDPFCRQLIHRLKKPLLSTSANISGQPAPGTYDEISPEIHQNVDFVVEHRRENKGPASPSSIIRWHGNGKFTIVRP